MFCNIQIGGSVFKHAETRQKNFTADSTAAGHQKVYAEIAAYFKDLADETMRLDHDREVEARVKSVIDMHLNLHRTPGSVEPIEHCFNDTCKDTARSWPDVVRRLDPARASLTEALAQSTS